jgi:hypothetical protein
MSRGRVTKGIALAALFLLALGLAGCSTPIGELPLSGTPADAPQPKDTGSYLPVNDRPPDRDEAVIDPAERARIQRELIAARERQAAAVAGKDTAAKDPAAKDPGGK